MQTTHTSSEASIILHLIKLFYSALWAWELGKIAKDKLEMAVKEIICLGVSNSKRYVFRTQEKLAQESYAVAVREANL